MCETAEIRKSYCTFASTLLKLWKYLDREDITPEMRLQKDAIEAIYKELQQKRKHADITDLSVAINEIVNEHLELDGDGAMTVCKAHGMLGTRQRGASVAGMTIRKIG